MPTAGTDLTQAAAAFIDAFNRADWQAFRGTVASDVVYSETGTGRRVEGADAYVELCRGWKTALPDVTGTISNAIASGDLVAQEVVWAGTHTGPLQTADGVIEATGSPISVDGTIWLRYAGDHAREIHHHLDVLALMQQIGAMPGPDA
jgi:steroid delta-isomerase-like uncharacterized protein